MSVNTAFGGQPFSSNAGEASGGGSTPIFAYIN